MTPKYFDIHAHTNFVAYDQDREEVIKRSLDNNVWITNVGTQKDTSKKAVELAERYEKGVYAIVGIHPIHADKSFHDKDELGDGGKEFNSRGEVFDNNYYENLAKSRKVVGIGETGLDYFRSEEGSLKKQRDVFESQIELANKVNLPLMLHVRPGKEPGKDAYKDTLDILKSRAKVGGNAHFFAGSVENAKGFLEIGFTISFTGVVTFTRDYDEVIRYAPLDMIMAETDCPYVSPTPFRGKRNEPLYVREVAERIAEIRGGDREKTLKALVDNSLRSFKIDSDK